MSAGKSINRFVGIALITFGALGTLVWGYKFYHANTDWVMFLLTTLSIAVLMCGAYLTGFMEKEKKDALP